LIYLRGLGFPTDQRPPADATAALRTPPGPPGPPPGPWGNPPK